MDKKKLAVMHCRNTGRNCTGSGCFRALYERRGAFELYKNCDAELLAFFDCCGCDADKLTDPNFGKKMNRLKELEIDCLHIAVCCTHKCEQLDTMEAALKQYGIPYMFGTH